MSTLASCPCKTAGNGAPKRTRGRRCCGQHGNGFQMARWSEQICIHVRTEQGTGQMARWSVSLTPGLTSTASITIAVSQPPVEQLALVCALPPFQPK
jgi:hypothetical protein